VINPYQPPDAPLEKRTDSRRAQVRILSLSGRIGRVRYIAYSTGLWILAYLVLAVAVGVVERSSGTAAGGDALAVLAATFVAVMTLALTIQRCHDFDVPGWLAPLGLIPVVNLSFWVIPGTDGTNRYGPQTSPNPLWTVILACMSAVISLAGLVAGVVAVVIQQVE